ncbi:MAG: hypothetical protein KAZ87_00855 [Spirochaetes bacterium]|nr:hypothetical protein [Spirochaetota bacterium]
MFKHEIFRFQKILCLILFVGSISCGANDSTDSSGLSDAEIDEKREAVLQYISDLSSGLRDGVLSGQNCGLGNEISDKNYNRFVEALYNQTGKYVSIVGVDYEFRWEHSIDDLKAANKVLKDHWASGGLVAVTMSPVNPWGKKHNWEDIRPSDWPGGKDEGTDLMKLITPGSDKYEGWMAKLDRLAEALLDLKKSGVIVLWRPMQEMNGWWFWWGKTDAYHLADQHPSYIAVWRHMHDYFTKSKNLNNLLWVFSPTQNQAFSTFPYPGDDYVDIVAGTEYRDDLSITGYDDFLAYNKPVGIAEYGPSEFGPKVDGSFDNILYLTRLKNDYPRIAFWTTWESWDGVKMSLVDNQNSSALLNDPYVLNRGSRP